MITLIVATTRDFFIADTAGNGDFSSPEDKKQLRAYLHSSVCDSFICGRKTADEFKNRLTYKPLFILSKGTHKNNNNLIYVHDIPELLSEMKKRHLTKNVLLGGEQVYHLFLENNLVDEIRRTEENLFFQNGKKLNWMLYERQFQCDKVKKISHNTNLFIYHRKREEIERAL